MKIALVGYGKMGKAIEQIAVSRGHEISFRINRSNGNDLVLIKPENTDVAIEFSTPEIAYGNVKTLIDHGVQTVCGSTGWLEKLSEIEKLAPAKNTAFFYASNFSVGVNVFFQINKVLAKMMNNFPDYDVWMEEIHHTQKLDRPSGTAITLAEGVIENIERKARIELFESSKKEDLVMIPKRIGKVPGTHLVSYDSMIDTIEIKHTAHSREGFALGSVLAAEFLKGKQGVFGMNDLLKF